MILGYADQREEREEHRARLFVGIQPKINVRHWYLL